MAEKGTCSTEMCRQTQGHASQMEDILLVSKINVLVQPGPQNHRMAEAGRDVQKSQDPIPHFKQAHLELICPGTCPDSF